MRGTVAKKIRRLARQHSKPTQHIGAWSKIWLGRKDENDKPVPSLVCRGTLVCTGYRRVYQDLKKAYLARRAKS